VAIPSSGSPGATIPGRDAGGWVLQITGRHFVPARVPPGWVDPAPHQANALVVFYDAALIPTDLSVSDQTANLATVGHPIAIPLSASCGTTTTQVPPPAPAQPPAQCPTNELDAHASLGVGGTGTSLVSVSFTNRSPTPCELPPPQNAQLLRGDGAALRTTFVNTRSTYRGPIPQQPSAVILPAEQPDSATMDLGWSNWCATAPGRLTLRLQFQQLGALTIPIVTTPPGDTITPRCDQPGSPSALEFANTVPTITPMAAAVACMAFHQSAAGPALNYIAQTETQAKAIAASNHDLLIIVGSDGTCPRLGAITQQLDPHRIWAYTQQGEIVLADRG
jgi:hypothetical protein